MTSTAMRAPGRPAVDDDGATVNEVRLRGRLAADPEEKVLPSGDVLVVARLVVPRAPEPGSRTRVDTVDLVARRAGPRRVLAGGAPGDVLEVEGRLHRRFWRGPAGPASRYEVEVLRARRGPRAART